MEIEGFKSAWQNHPVESSPIHSAARKSMSLQFVRAGAIRDVERSNELARVVFCVLFALIALAGSFVVMPAGAARIAAWLFACALIVDGALGLALLFRRYRAPATGTMLEFISEECRQGQTRIRLERYAYRLVFVLAGVAALVLIFTPRPPNFREGALDALMRMAILTAFLAFAWRRAKSRSKEVHRELERFLADLRE